VAFGKTTSSKLIDNADSWFDLSTNPKKFLMTKYK